MIRAAITIPSVSEFITTLIVLIINDVIVLIRRQIAFFPIDHGFVWIEESGSILLVGIRMEINPLLFVTSHDSLRKEVGGVGVNPIWVRVSLKKKTNDFRRLTPDRLIRVTECNLYLIVFVQG
jgi:hypothetical protein